MASDYQISETSGDVVPGKFGWIATAAALAAAAVLAIFVLQPAFLFPPDMDDVRAAAQQLATRPTSGRFDDFAYKKAFSPKRGDGDDADLGNVTLLEIADKAKDPYVKGMALLHSETGGDFYAEAIANLEEAHRTARPAQRDAIAIDLAAALLSSWSNEAGHKRALHLSDEVLARNQSPAARLNRALALEYLDRKEAAQAWAEYLQLDPSSPWAEEIRRRDDLNADP